MEKYAEPMQDRSKPKITARERHEAARDFARYCIQGAFDCTVDGIAVQEAAEAFGLIVARDATEEDCMGGFEGAPGDTIYVIVDWLR